MSALVEKDIEKFDTQVTGLVCEFNSGVSVVESV